MPVNVAVNSITISFDRTMVNGNITMAYDKAAHVALAGDTLVKVCAMATKFILPDN